MREDHIIIDIVEVRINELAQEDESITKPRIIEGAPERVSYHLLHEKYFYQALDEVELSKEEKERLIKIFGYKIK
jgi:hypothetical protein